MVSAESNKNILQKAWDAAQEFWLISLLMMTFTFLSQLEKLTQFSAYLSLALSWWRDALRWAVEFIPNLILKLFNLHIDIYSPWPEIIFFFSLVTFSYFRREKMTEVSMELQNNINNTPLKIFTYFPIKAYHLLGEQFYDEYDIARARFFLFVFMAPPIAIIAFVLFQNHYVSFLALSFSVACVIVVTRQGFRDTAFSQFIGSFTIGVSWLVLYFSVLMVMFSNILDAVLPPALEFRCLAFERSGLELPNQCK